MNRLVIKECWEERIYNIKKICIVDEDNDEIETEILTEEMIEVVDSGDIREIDAQLPSYKNDIDRFKKENKKLLC